MNIGIVDSGSFAGHMREHGSLDTNYTVGDRFFSVVAQGGDTGPTPGYYDPAFNDLHGTHVSGTVAASRDGVGETQPTGPDANMHGVAFNSRRLHRQHRQDRRRALRPAAADARRSRRRRTTPTSATSTAP